MREYSHVVIDKNGVGLGKLRERIRENELLTAEASGYAAEMAEGPKKREHHLNIFLWADTILGEKGNIESRFCFIEGLHIRDTENFDRWYSGLGW